MINFVDICILIIFLFMILEGYIKGLMRSLIGFFGYIFALIMGKIYYIPMTKYLQKNFEWFRNLKPKISESLLSNVHNQVSKGVVNSTANSNLSPILQNKEMAQNPELVNNFMKSIKQFSTSTDTTAVNLDFMQKSVDTISDGIVHGIGFFIVVIGCLLIVKIIGLILDVATEAPIIKQVNKLGGIIFGVLKGGILVFVLMMLAMYVAPLFPELDLINSIYSSHIGVYFYEHNLLLLALHSFMNI